MCGRFTLNLAELADLRLPLGLDAVEITDWSARYNIAPMQQVPVATQNGARFLRYLRWGLVPSWAKDEASASRLINARVESIADKPSFRDAFMSRRCVVPANGYFEWQAVADSRRKQPMWIRSAAEEVLWFAGLWERNQRGPEPLYTFTIVTTEASADVRPIHDRMPLALTQSDRERWLLGPAPDRNALAEIVERATTQRQHAYPVSLRVNDVRVDDEACIAPLLQTPPRQLTLLD